MIIRCPACKHKMNYLPRDGRLNRSKKKKCVYCNKSFIVAEHLVKK